MRGQHFFIIVWYCKRLLHIWWCVVSSLRHCFINAFINTFIISFIIFTKTYNLFSIMCSINDRLYRMDKIILSYEMNFMMRWNTHTAYWTNYIFNMYRNGLVQHTKILVSFQHPWYEFWNIYQHKGHVDYEVHVNLWLGNLCIINSLKALL